MKLDKLMPTTDLRKATAQTANLSDPVALSLQGIRQAVVERQDDESVRDTIRRFTAAWARYDSTSDKSAAAKQFAAEIDAVIHERQLARSLQSSLQKGMSAFDFFNRR